ncbi:MAG: hypothetical protein Ct9H300mP16_14810 [Pseudomonadota bacterium]|nr:MAG: hypothetical protein Ct9H300mP16_14810 [Pseudomonadota bacterium]
MGSFADKRVVVSGASRGIGLAIAKKLASDGASIAILAKTTEPHPKLPGTIYTPAEEIVEAGGKGAPLVTDIRSEDQVQAAVAEAAPGFWRNRYLHQQCQCHLLTPTSRTEMRRFDLMFGVNVRGTFMLSRECLPHLLQAENPHILNISPPSICSRSGSHRTSLTPCPSSA